MAQFDVYRIAGHGYAIDCQSDLLSHYTSRFTVPLRALDDAPKPAAKLNPQFEVSGEAMVMMTQFAGTVPVKALTDRVASLAEHDLIIKTALDVLTGTY